MPEPSRLRIRVYYEDTDFSGVVYHANYLRFLERGRTEFLRELGIAQAELFAGGRPLAFAVTKLAIAFHKPAIMDDLLDIETDGMRLGRASLELRQRVARDGTVLADATVTVAAVAGGRPVRLPPGLVARLACFR